MQNFLQKLISVSIILTSINLIRAEDNLKIVSLTGHTLKIKFKKHSIDNKRLDQIHWDMVIKKNKSATQRRRMDIRNMSI